MSAVQSLRLDEGRFLARPGQFCLLWHQAPARRRRMNRNLVAQARKQLLRRGRALLRAAQAGTAASARPDALGAIDEAELTELQEIHAALERIERGIFGRCEECQGDIEDERVERVPWERRCDACRGEELAEGAEAEAEANETRATA